VSEIRFVFDVPPTTNKLYQTRRGGQKALTTVAKAYKNHVSTVVKDNLAKVSRLPVDKERVYLFWLTVYFEQLENPGWFKKFVRGKNKGERKAKDRYKRLDVDNRVKFVQDCVAKSLGIDDCQIFRSVQEKMEDRKNPHAVVVVSLLPRQLFIKEVRSEAT